MTEEASADVSVGSGHTAGVYYFHSEERKGNKTTMKLKQVQYIFPIFRFEKQTTFGG